MNKIDEKDRRKQRRQYRRNEIARDLYTPKYRQRVIPNKNKADRFYEEEIEYHDDQTN